MVSGSPMDQRLDQFRSSPAPSGSAGSSSASVYHDSLAQSEAMSRSNSLQRSRSGGMLAVDTQRTPEEHEPGQLGSSHLASPSPSMQSQSHNSQTTDDEDDESEDQAGTTVHSAREVEVDRISRRLSRRIHTHSQSHGSSSTPLSATEPPSAGRAGESAEEESGEESTVEVEEDEDEEEDGDYRKRITLPALATPTASMATPWPFGAILHNANTADDDDEEIIAASQDETSREPSTPVLDYRATRAAHSNTGGSSRRRVADPLLDGDDSTSVDFERDEEFEDEENSRPTAATRQRRRNTLRAGEARTLSLEAASGMSTSETSSPAVSPSTTTTTIPGEEEMNKRSEDFDEMSMVLAGAEGANGQITDPAKLPHEILLAILRLVTSTKDLQSCLLVCKSWCQCGVELLWHRPMFARVTSLLKMLVILRWPKQTFHYSSFVRKLNFSTLASDMSDQILSRIACCERLERLTLINCTEITDNSLATVLSHCHNIVALDLTDCKLITDKSILVAARHLSRLQGVNLGGCKELTDISLNQLALNCRLLRRVKLRHLQNISCVPIVLFSQNCPLLLEVDTLSCPQISDASLWALWRYSTHLRELSLNYCVNITDAAFPIRHGPSPSRLFIGEAGAYLAREEALRQDQLDLIGPLAERAYESVTTAPQAEVEAVTDAVLSEYTKLQSVVPPPAVALGNHSVESFRGRGEQSGSPGTQPAPHSRSQGARDGRSNARPTTSFGLPMVHITSKNFEHLRYLDMTGLNKITDAAIASIVANMPRIRNLILCKCTNLTDESIYSICKLGKHLQFLHLGHVGRLTDSAITMLTRRCTRLRYIDVACCPLLTDMSVQEMAAGLTKLKRIGLVRVTNLTDLAISALMQRSSLERVHLSYCENISVPAIHALLQQLRRLTHLSLTGVPAFRRPELQLFCRSPPDGFNTHQRQAFCVYSGEGVRQLRDHLARTTGSVGQLAAFGQRERHMDRMGDRVERFHGDLAERIHAERAQAERFNLNLERTQSDLTMRRELGAMQLDNGDRAEMEEDDQTILLRGELDGRGRPDDAMRFDPAQTDLLRVRLQEHRLAAEAVAQAATTAPPNGPQAPRDFRFLGPPLHMPGPVQLAAQRDAEPAGNRQVMTEGQQRDHFANVQRVFQRLPLREQEPMPGYLPNSIRETSQGFPEYRFLDLAGRGSLDLPDATLSRDTAPSSSRDIWQGTTAQQQAHLAMLQQRHAQGHEPGRAQQDADDEDDFEDDEGRLMDLDR
ncbi:uncharacterized protein L969DRAFT_44274 [Mixia osmundae IAM 14324]|uniref:Uncharacterized protein n=1 Tax=Mixia osmundae (strain CBS 9802 / IAM 14324 / JCM 22182 / KY 12970) TaxID=764103 RepID=G7E316_MIXOS|nr:uncharacterized protein L969DRAFT_44274 [Mixia osmundae IAM 14324]KEI42514.1 hypothetical protein L969DRAFT_44274 [Mixia osmundae IAM 14324]GAA97197.1 hypothetical protein E5Q_03873 [Mixia osmundae IAM 14324]